MPEKGWTFDEDAFWLLLYAITMKNEEDKVNFVLAWAHAGRKAAIDFLREKMAYLDAERG